MPLSWVRAKEPFRFFSRLSLTIITGKKVKNVRELLDEIKQAPDGVIYQHTHRFLQEYQYWIHEPPNDFSIWVSQALKNETLGEKLSAIDTVRYRSLQDLRQALVTTLEKYFKQGGQDREALEGEEFSLLQTVRFSLPTTYQAQDLLEFRDILKKISLSSLYLHVFEARLRPPLGKDDFSHWLEGELEEKGLAKQMAKLNPYTQTLEGLRQEILAMLDRRIAEFHG
ncbi:MAG: hypothetical protein HY399_01085 [Elusimicrobia bacterium]|nr:hypothetical protein [Elusimicrobiota bacterium]